MPSSPKHPAPATTNLSEADAEDLELYREKFRRRLPKSLDELRGPTQGIVHLPLHMAWSGMTPYDMDKPRQRMGLYRTVLHDDLPRYLNQDLLLQMWPVLRTLVGRAAWWTVRARTSMSPPRGRLPWPTSQPPSVAAWKHGAGR
ncbi:hypothetical protein MBT84_45505 [Streptomyces sp. MBT84]|uniref:hypothetical protein n=1 Tax=Streptomyces sp. MBT84 TaxID=1488414 RepID=UPI001D88AC43|nr:hypothetical protein [Streptomyces sp. MBT84]MBW8706911.1 hypothetical protein [Streptomyces sp. MBT84]